MESVSSKEGSYDFIQKKQKQRESQLLLSQYVVLIKRRIGPLKRNLLVSMSFSKRSWAARMEFQKNYGKWIVMLKIIMAPDGPLIFIIFIF